MITHSQARSMAEANWGRGGTNSRRTNRAGAFYFSCSGHGGYIIDGRAFSEEERAALAAFREPEKTSEVYDPTDGRVHGIFNPFSLRQRTIKAMPHWRQRDVEVWAFEEDCDWCLPVIFAGITTGDNDPKHALGTFKRWMNPSNHQMIEAVAIFSRHFPDLASEAQAQLEPAAA